MTTHQWIKHHILNFVMNGVHTRQSLLDANVMLWRNDDEVNRTKIDTEINRLIETKQLVVDEANNVHLGLPCFEDAEPVTEKASKAAEEIFNNLCTRRGIRHELDDLDADIKEELLNTMARIIDKNMLC